MRAAHDTIIRSENGVYHRFRPWQHWNIVPRGGYEHKTDREEIPVMDTDGKAAQIDTILARRASVKHQLEREMYLIAAVFVRVGAWVSRVCAADGAEGA